MQSLCGCGDSVPLVLKENEVLHKSKNSIYHCSVVACVGSASRGHNQVAVLVILTCLH